MAKPIKVNILGDATSLEKALGKSNKQLAAFGKKLTRNVTLPVLAAGVAATKMASDLAESMSKAVAVFGDGSGLIIEASENMQDSFSQAEFLDFAGTLGNIAQAMGIAAGDSDTFSLSVLSLAQDLGSFNNVPTGQAVNAITTALTGETEAMKKLGVVIKQADIQHRALADRAAGVTGELTKEEKAMATFAIITEGAGAAVGDFERTIDGVANQSKITTKNMVDMGAKIGTDLLPVANELLAWAQKVTGAFSSMPKELQTLLLLTAGLAAVMGPLVSAIAAVNAALVVLRAKLIATNMAGGPLLITLGLVAAAAVFIGAQFSSSADEVELASDRIKGLVSSLASTLDQVTGATTESTRAFVASEIEASGMGAAFADMGVTADDFIATMSGPRWSEDIARPIITLGHAMVASGEITEEQRLRLQDLQFNGLDPAQQSVENMAFSLGTMGGAALSTSRSIGVFADVLVGFTDSMFGAQRAENSIADSIAGVQAAMVGQTSSFGGAAKSAADLAAELKDLEGAELAVADSLQAKRAAHLAAWEASNDERDAIMSVTDAELALIKVRESTVVKVDAEDEDEAERSIVKAQLRQRGAALALSDAEAQLAEVQADKESTADDIAKAQLRLDRSTLAVVESNEVLFESEADLVEVRSGAEARAEAIAEAEEALEAAKDGSADASDVLAAAELELSRASDDVTVAVEKQEKVLADQAVAVGRSGGAVRDLAAEQRNLEAATDDAVSSILEQTAASMGITGETDLTAESTRGWVSAIDDLLLTIDAESPLFKRLTEFRDEVSEEYKLNWDLNLDDMNGQIDGWMASAPGFTGFTGGVSAGQTAQRQAGGTASTTSNVTNNVTVNGSDLDAADVSAALSWLASI